MTTALFLALLGLQGVNHEFRYEADKDYKTVSVAGTFNAWNNQANPMTQNGRVWTATINLQPGAHQYKFVLDGTTWITDPKGKDVADGNGHTNTALTIVPPDFLKAPGRLGDSLITESAIEFRPEVPFVNYDQGQIRVRIRTRANDVMRVEVRSGGKDILMSQKPHDELYDYWVAKIPWDKKKKLDFYFACVDASAIRLVGPSGITSYDRKNVFTLDPMTYKPFEVPAWVENTVFYQIFPDRFDNGDKKNDPKEKTEWLGAPTYSNRYGGDMAGIRRRVPYLKRLGVNAIYINPVMAANSNHRYDPGDFYKIDPEFGTNDEFAELTKHMDKEGVKVVLDQIFDHVGITFPPFVDVLKNQQNSKYKDWFFIKSWPVEVRPNPPYVGWWGTEYMPKINLANKEAYDYLMKSVDFWMAKATLAGWRLDVANEAPQWFWKDFRKRVKGIDPNAWIVGEVWTDASEWLKGDQWDASMNYPFRDVCIQFFAKKQTKPSEFVNGLMRVHNLYAPQVSRNQLNLISSHDVPRFMHEANGDRKMAAMAAITQFTWPGAPSVYYGEELGMDGGADPMNRKGMRWDLATSKNELLELYTKLAHIRTRVKVLAAGEPVIFNQDDAKQVAAYGRRWSSDFAVVAFNRSDKPQEAVIQLPIDWKKEIVNALTGERIAVPANGKLSIDIPPVSAFFGLNASNHHLTIIAGASSAAKNQLSVKEPLP